jgi:hypothetical protein
MWSNDHVRCGNIFGLTLHLLWWHHIQKNLSFFFGLDCVKMKVSRKMKAELWNFSCQMQEFCCCEQYKGPEMGYILYSGAFITCDYDMIMQFPTSWQWPGNICSKLMFWNCVKLSENNKSNLHYLIPEYQRKSPLLIIGMSFDTNNWQTLFVTGKV